MRLSFGLAFLATACIALSGGGAARADCKIQQVGELPVVLAEGHILLPTSINGQPVMMLADTGAFTSGLFTGAPEKLGLGARAFANNHSFHTSGIGGLADSKVATVKEMRFGNFVLHDTDLLVTGRQLGSSSVVGVIGADLFAKYDVEIDAAHGVIRLLRPVGCSDAQMPYWGAGYSQAPLEAIEDRNPKFNTAVTLNGHSVQAMLDTGAFATVITPSAAEAAGAKPEEGGPKGTVGGIGSNKVETSVYLFDTVGIGDETVKNTRLRVADVFRYNKVEKTGSRLGYDTSDRPHVIVGLDFFRSHHVLISPSHHMIYFSYVGGQVFMSPPRPASVVQPPTNSATAAAPPKS